VFIALATLAALSLFLNLWQWVVALRFPLHQRVRDASFAPPVTLLKPLKGMDANSRRCLQSWFAQDYPAPAQILFGAASADDPVCALVNELIRENPRCDARLVICGESLGANSKISSLIQLHRLAQHEIIIVSDADVFVAPDLLRNAVAPLRDNSIGLVNCFYRLANPATLAMRWEAVAINADFWSQVLQGRSLAPLDFALGAVMVLRRESLAKIGGFEALADYLADDFQIGNRIARMTGGSIAICPVVVDCLDAPLDWHEAWAHQLRWARTIRVSKPLPYALSILGNATLWPLLWAAVAPSELTWLALAFCALVRVITAQSLQSRLGPVPRQSWFFWLAPVKDIMQCALWVAAFFGNHITWRGERFRLQRDGRLARE
jgi:ceramide glucosyltransferase